MGTLEEAPDAPLSVMLSFAVGRSIGVAGRQMLSIAVGYELYERTGSKFLLGLVGLVQVIPVFALFVPGGILVDRVDRRWLSTASMSLGALGCALMAWASWSTAPLAAIYAVLLLLGATSAIQSPAASALLPMLVSKAQLQRANAIRSTGFQVAAVAGPAVAGAMLDAVRPYVVYSVATGLCALSAASFLLLPKPRVAPKPKAPARGDLLVGLRFIFRSPLLLPALTLDMVAVLFAGATALLPVFAKDVLHIGASGLGALRAAPAVGAAVMALISARLPPWKHPGRVLLAVVIGYGLATIGFGLSTWFWLSMGLLALSGALDNVSVIIRLTLEQVVVPDEIRGRVGAVHYVFIGMSNELGEAESGLAAALIGTVPSVVAGGAIAVVWTLIVAGVWPRLRTLKPLHELRATNEGAG